MSGVNHAALRILMVVENCGYPRDTRVRHEAETLVEAGYKVSVLCPREHNQPWQQTINGVQAYRYPAPPAGSGLLGYVIEFGYAMIIITLFILWRWLRDRYHVIHFHNPPDTLFITAIPLKLVGTQIVFDHHDLSPELYESKYEHPRPLIRRLLLWLEYRCCRAADWVIAVNESYRQNDIQRNHVAPERVGIVRNGPDLNRLYQRPPDPDLQARAETLIAFVGYMARQDGIDHLLDALHHLRFDLGYHDWFCVIIGKADDPESLYRLASGLRISDQVWFTGFIPDEQMLRFLSTADLCVVPDPANPLNDKSTMQKIMEYMALSKPLVAYDLVEHRVSAGDSALFARPNDPRDMAQQIAHLIDDPALRVRLGAIGRQRVEQQLAWDYSAKCLVEFYDKVTRASLAERSES
jgi:glycosyltransferase involved in cell wall biosynthesis